MSDLYTEEQKQRDLELSSQADPVEFHFQPTRRDFVQTLGAGILLAATVSVAKGAVPGGARGGRGDRGGGRGGGIGGAPISNLGARLHIAKDGIITVLCGKVECGQGVRAEITQAAAEELGVPTTQIRVILADTDLVPNDGPTVGSRSTPATVPAVRQAAAAAKQLLIGLAATSLSVPAGDLSVTQGAVIHASTNRRKTYADLASAQDLDQLLRQSSAPANVTLTRVAEWKILGTTLGRPNARDVVTGTHPYPADTRRPGMLYGKILRAPRYRSTVAQADVAKAKAMKDVVVVQDNNFIGVAAPTTVQAEAALAAIDARWQSQSHPASTELIEYFRSNVQMPPNTFTAQKNAAAKNLKATYFIPYVQHAPMEPRAAVAEWSNGKLTVWTATQQPWGVRDTLASTFNLTAANVRVIVPDFGGGFGGKHQADCVVEAARLAQAAGKPVSLRYTREEEFTVAYFRPAGVMECEASLDAAGKITSWYFINIHSGGSAVATPYAINPNLCQTVNMPAAQQPLRVGSYRGLAATANAFARECFMDELAAAANKDPLEFRLAHLENPRLRAVLETACQRFDWPARIRRATGNTAVGLACATEKGSFVATCAQITLDRTNTEGPGYKIDHITKVFECGKVLNPLGCKQQVEGGVIQALGPILREEMIFEDGRMQNPVFADYKVPRFSDVPPMDVYLLDRPDLDSQGSGETPLITVAPAIANAVSKALGNTRIRQLPITLS